MPTAVIGAGGVARAVVAGLTDVGAEVTIYNRTVAKARRLAERFDCTYKSLDELKSQEAVLLVNCTSIGMHPDTDRTPIPGRLLRDDFSIPRCRP